MIQYDVWSYFKGAKIQNKIENKLRKKLLIIF